MDLILMAAYFAGIGFTLSFLTLGRFKISSVSSNISQVDRKKKKRKVLVVTAHPDDECMFFGPSILHFTQKEHSLVYLLCLSPGSYYKEGIQRTKELWSSCMLLGIPSENIILYNCEDLPDNPSVMWPTYHTSQIICNNIYNLDIDMVITFDARGVSGHINHCAINNALDHLIEEKDLPTNCEVYYLDSVNILRKYSSIFDVFFSYTVSQYAFTVDFHQFSTILKAMKAHASQFVWFRKLYFVFSRYVLINTLRKVK